MATIFKLTIFICLCVNKAVFSAKSDKSDKSSKCSDLKKKEKKGKIGTYPFSCTRYNNVLENKRTFICKTAPRN